MASDLVKKGIVAALLSLASGHVGLAASSCAVALVPGAFAEDSVGSRLFVGWDEYFSEYETFFRAKGCATKKIQFPPDATIEVRAIHLRDQLQRFATQQGRKVFVIAHSQAGLDLRFALKRLGLRDVEAWVSVGTPHRGTPVADWVLAVREKRGGLYWALRILAGYDLAELRFLGEMTGNFLEKHAEHFMDVPGVRAASVRCVCQKGCSRSLRLLAWAASMGPGDGLVPEASQTWGEDLGRFELDHVSEVGVDFSGQLERARLLRAAAEFFGIAQRQAVR